MRYLADHAIKPAIAPKQRAERDQKAKQGKDKNSRLSRPAPFALLRLRNRKIVSDFAVQRFVVPTLRLFDRHVARGAPSSVPCAGEGIGSGHNRESIAHDASPTG